ncbi:MAG: LamG domain-containing protein [Planctomycetales bacterium]|nr:LamG domain-containing protein [Planctomycetales bacterium]
MKRLVCILFSAWACCGAGSVALAQDAKSLGEGLIGHWPLVKDAKDVSGNGRDAMGNGVVWRDGSEQEGDRAAAVFDGRGAALEVAAHAELKLGCGDFSVAAWVWADEASDDVPGDILSQYDPATRRGFHLGVKTNTGVTFNQANFRQLQFGVDNDRISNWRDCGQPGKNSLLAFGLVAHKGRLFAGTCEPGEGDTGRVYQYSHGQEWLDLGSPAPSNAITAMTAFNGELYVGTGKYRVAGSSLAESSNTNLGGRVFRYDGTRADGTSTWTDCGQLPNAEAVSGMVVFQGRLYAGSLYKPAGFFRYEGDQQPGDQKWSDIGVPDGKRVEALAIFNGHLYASSYDCGHVYRFDGQTWADLGQLGDSAINTQTYSFAVYEGRLYAGTWRSGKVYRLEESLEAKKNPSPPAPLPARPGRGEKDHAPRVEWRDVGQLGEELEVMGMLVHNGRLMAGTLPLAEVYQFEGGRHVNGGERWKRLTQLDTTPDVKYRRAWTMAEYQGQLFCSTLPSGHVHACEVGKLVTWDKTFPPGWHHVAAVKSGGKLLLFVDGKLKSSSTDFNADDFDLSNDQPLRIGSGPNDFFHGRLRDVRLYRRALSQAEVGAFVP